jgi:hypothetical protein
MSSTLYARGTLLQTGVKQRAERTEQAIHDLFQQLESTRRELSILKKENEEIKQCLNRVYALTGIPIIPQMVTGPHSESGSA